MGSFPQTHNNPNPRIYFYPTSDLSLSGFFSLIIHFKVSSTLPEDHALMTLEWYPVLSEFLQMRVKIGM